MYRLEKYEVLDLIKGAIAEDMGGYGDITSKYLITEDGPASSFIICKEPGGGILSGIDIATYIFEEIDKRIKVKPLKTDGDAIRHMERICDIEGPASSVLRGERTCLNFIQHMSGIATYTGRFTEIAGRCSVKIVDTRKTKPCLRKIEKYAVRCGGGYNHRFGLFDGVLIKDNHIAAAGSVTAAIENTRKNAPHTLKIEVEVKDFNELSQALEGSADIIMLDNMNPEDIKKAVGIIREKDIKTLIEASGNVNLDTLESICMAGIDLISVGAITHSAPAIDLSLEFT